MLIFQPAGIGDIMFCQYICKHYVQKGYNVTYPLNLLPPFLFEPNLIQFISKSNELDGE